MTGEKNQFSIADELYKRAEERGIRLYSQEGLSLESDEARHLFRGMQSRVLELEKQNEELVQALSELEEGHSHYYELYDGAPVGYCAISAAGVVLEANLTAASMLGMAEGMLINVPFARLVLPADRDVFTQYHKLLEQTDVPQSCELRLRRTNGDVFWAGLEGNCAKCVDGTTLSRLILSDISGRKRTEQALKRAKESAVLASRAKSRFLAWMSHELRTPLTAILGFSEVLADCTFGELNTKQARYVTNVLEAGRHLLSLINDILDLSKVEAGKMDLDLEDIPVQRVLQDSIVLVKEKADKNSLSLKVKAPKGLTVSADERKLKQILFNLLSNAVKFTPEGGKIEVTARVCEHLPENSARRQGKCWNDRIHASILAKMHPPHFGPSRWLEVAVADTGVGIKPEDQKRLFHLFEQLESSSELKHQGTGLGLALSSNFVELHGGRIWVESEGEGKGSVFRFVIPMFDDVTTSGGQV